MAQNGRHHINRSSHSSGNLPFRPFRGPSLAEVRARRRAMAERNGGRFGRFSSSSDDTPSAPFHGPSVEHIEDLDAVSGPSPPSTEHAEETEVAVDRPVPADSSRPPKAPQQDALPSPSQPSKRSLPGASEGSRGRRARASPLLPNSSPRPQRPRRSPPPVSSRSREPLRFDVTPQPAAPTVRFPPRRHSPLRPIPPSHVLLPDDETIPPEVAEGIEDTLEFLRMVGDLNFDGSGIDDRLGEPQNINVDDVHAEHEMYEFEELIVSENVDDGVLAFQEKNTIGPDHRNYLDPKTLRGYNRRYIRDHADRILNLLPLRGPREKRYALCWSPPDAREASSLAARASANAGQAARFSAGSGSSYTESTQTPAHLPQRSERPASGSKEPRTTGRRQARVDSGSGIEEDDGDESDSTVTEKVIDKGKGKEKQPEGGMERS